MCPMNRTSSRELLVAVQRGGGPLHAQVEAQLRDGVRSGRLAAGERLPVEPGAGGRARRLARRRRRGLRAARRRGLPRGRPRRRTARRARRRSPRRGRPSRPPPALRYDLRPGTPDLALFPRAAWAAAQRRALREVADAELGYPPPGGHPRLRAALAAYLGRVRGVQAAPERIVVCGGVAEAVAMVGRVLRAGGARRIAVEDPSHPGTRELIAHSGVELVAVAVDAGGIDVAAVAASRADAVLVTPAHQSATGVVLEPARRAALAAWARDTGALVIEDDYDAEYRYDRHPVGALQGVAPDHVVHVHSVSKTLAPALRLGWAAVPARLVAAVVEEKRLSDLGAPVLEQLTLAAFLERGELDRHLRRTRPGLPPAPRRAADRAGRPGGRGRGGRAARARPPPARAVRDRRGRGGRGARRGGRSARPPCRRPLTAAGAAARLHAPPGGRAGRGRPPRFARALRLQWHNRTDHPRREFRWSRPPPGSSWSPTRPPPRRRCSTRSASAPRAGHASSRCSSRTPTHGLHKVVDPEDQSQGEAETTIELALPLLEDAAGGPVDAMIGVPEPLAAIQDAINLHGFDELIISTLPTQRVEVAQARPAAQGRRPRAAGDDRHGALARGRGGLAFGGGAALLAHHAGADRRVRRWRA